MFAPSVLFDFDIELSAIVHDGCRLAAMHHARLPQHVARFVRLHTPLSITGYLKPGARTDKDNKPVRMRVDRRHFAISDGNVKNTDGLVFERYLVDVWSNLGGIEGIIDTRTDSQPGRKYPSCNQWCPTVSRSHISLPQEFEYAPQVASPGVCPLAALSQA